MRSNDIDLIAHLMRRAGFGAGRDELAASTARGYDATVEVLMNVDGPDGVQEDLLRRYHPEERLKNRVRNTRSKCPTTG